MSDPRRKRMIVDGIQIRLLWINLAHFAFILLVFLAAIFGPVIADLYTGDLAAAERQEVANQFLALHARLWPAMGVVLVFLALHSLVISHRIGGPLYRFRKTLKNISAGDLSEQLRLRKGDYLTNEADAFNEAFGAINSKVAALRRCHAALLDATNSLHDAERDPSIRDTGSGLMVLEARLRELGDELDWFKGPDEAGIELSTPEPAKPYQSPSRQPT